MRTAPYANLLTFPRVLREAIPDQPTMAGRVLNLATIDAAAARSLAATLIEMSARAEALEPGPGW